MGPRNRGPQAYSQAGTAALCLSGQRPSSRRAMISWTRDLLVRQRTQLINALRGRPAEHGIVAAQGQRTSSRLPMRSTASKPNSLRLLGILPVFISNNRASRWEDHRSRKETATRGGGTERDGRPPAQSMSGIGPITAMAIEVFAPPPESWNCRTSMSQERQRPCTWKSTANCRKGFAPSPNA